MVRLREANRLKDEKVAELESRLEQQSRVLQAVSDPARMSVCGYKNYFSESNSSVVYSELLHSETKLPTGGLDPRTGQFTVGRARVHTVTWSLLAENRQQANMSGAKTGFFMFAGERRVEDPFTLWTSISTSMGTNWPRRATSPLGILQSIEYKGTVKSGTCTSLGRM